MKQKERITWGEALYLIAMWTVIGLILAVMIWRSW